MLRPEARELVLGGQKSGKSRRAEQRAADWLAAAPSHDAVLLATGEAHDEEMRARIARHRCDRARRVPGLRTVEEPLHLAETLAAHSASHRLVLVDCLTLWLTRRLMPVPGASPVPGDWREAAQALVAALRGAPGPVLLVSNEIGLGVIAPAPEVRAFVDALGRLNQQVAAACDRVTLMVAGQALAVKGGGT